VLTLGLRCKRFEGEEHTKNGFMRGKQRYRCRACGLNFTDTPPRGAAYQEAIPQGQLYVGKDQTHSLEHDHARQRHWLARFRRRSIAFFGGNGRIGELTAMLA
jgi:transposase-like protein